MYIIAGLGNPTLKYRKTRHNVGFEAIDKMADQYSISLDTKKHKGKYGMGMINGNKVLLVKPQTYMNLSGECIHSLVNYYRVDPVTELIVIYDDIDLDVGQIRLRKKGSAGGHNGVKSIISHLGTQEFPRVKIGVGAKPPGFDLADYVLSRFDKEERKAMEEAQERAVEATVSIIAKDIEQAMNLFNKKV